MEEINRKETVLSSERNQYLGTFQTIYNSRPDKLMLIFGSRVYTSIERCILTESADIEWVMATASDAKGNLPMAAQKLGVPGAIVNDVGFFIGWTANNRSSANRE